MSLNDKSWNERSWISGWWTDSLMAYLKHSGQISSYLKSNLESDKEDAIDYLIEGKPSQFKLRVNSHQHDIGVNYMQPFYGFDRPINNVSPLAAKASRENFIGRDIKGLMKGLSEEYYVAIKNKDGLFFEIYKVSTKTILSEIEHMEEEWNAVEQFDGQWRNPFWKTRKDVLTSASIGKGCVFVSSHGHEIWVHKNEGEDFCKINYYLKEHIKEKSFVIPLSVSRGIEKLFQTTIEKKRKENESISRNAA